MLKYFTDVATVKAYFAAIFTEKKIFIATAINMLLRVFPKRENIHSVILVCVVTLVNMNYI